MEKTSTLFYSIHNLASNTEHQFTNTKDLDGISEYPDVYENLDKLEMVDVRQEIVDSILEFTYE